jgi:hypothetical protein
MVAEAEELKTQLAASRRQLFRAIEGVTEEQFRKRPEPGAAGDWSMSERLSHLLWSERGRAERIELALRQDGALVAATSAEADAEGARAGRRAPVPQLIHGLLAVRRAIVQPDGLKVTVRELLYAVLAEERAHVARIEALRAAAGLATTAAAAGPGV